MLAALPAGADVIVTSAVGMDVNTSRADLLPEMLAAVLAGGPVEPDGAGAIWRLRAAMPAGLRGAIARAIPDRAALALTARLELRGIDWATTRAFAHPADNQGYVRLNLRGRERGGVVAPEAAEGLMEEIAAGLAALSGPRRRARGRLGRRVRRSCTAVAMPTGFPISSCAGRTGRRPGSPSCARSASGRCAAAAAAPGAPATTRRATPGRWQRPGGRPTSSPPRPPRLVDVAATICELTGADPAGPARRAAAGRAGDAPRRARTPSELQLRLAWVADLAQPPRPRAG